MSKAQEWDRLLRAVLGSGAMNKSKGDKRAGNPLLAAVFRSS